MWSPLIYTIGSILNAVNLFTQGYFLVLYGDLEIDYINPIDLCNKINPYVIPDMLVHLSLCLILLLTGHFWTFLFNVPLLVFNYLSYRSGRSVLDATEIFKTVSKYKRNSFIRLIFHLFAFFYYIFNMIIAIIGHAVAQNESRPQLMT
ncbi:cornichon family protein [Starmerella bacillaris]|uniref:Cornichon family protein n=1 Tax=Starmerella bacillaris TaxID=1247836 RepID=A0AAV5RLR6_STABA|nr:cornichon family protein [Starmerella bacillaris]